MAFNSFCSFWSFQNHSCVLPSPGAASRLPVICRFLQQKVVRVGNDPTRTTYHFQIPFDGRSSATAHRSVGVLASAAGSCADLWRNFKPQRLHVAALCELVAQVVESLGQVV